MLKTIASRFFGCLVAAAASTSFVVTPATAQSSGAVPATCTINAAGTSLTCTTTISLSGVNGTFNSGTLTLNAQSTGPTCSGGLTASPSSGIAPNTATAIQLTACPNNTNNSQLNFRWISPAVASGVSAWTGLASANLPSGGSTQYSVDVCASADQNAACTRVTTTVTAAGASFACGAVSPSNQTVFQNNAAQILSVSCPGATSYQWYLGSSPTSGTQISGATQSSYTPSTASVGTATYSVRAFNSTQAQADSTGSATVAVQQQQSGGACPAGEPRVTINWGGASNNGFVGFQYQTMVGDAPHVTQINVGNVSSSSLQYPPNYQFAQVDTATYADRETVVSSRCDGVGGQRVINGFSSGVLQLVTTGDSRSGQRGFATVTPNSTWYIITRNLNCPSGVDCKMSGSYRNWGF